MRLTLDNFTNVIHEGQQGLVKALLGDLSEINSGLNECGFEGCDLYIEIQDWHDDISPENLEAHDKYGSFRIKAKNNPFDSLCSEMTIDDVDLSLCVLYNFVENLKTTLKNN